MNETRSTPAPDPNRLQRLAADPAASVWVSASAGSGKTKVLTDRVLALLLTGSAPERILCITFTKAAAAEMANRLTKRLGRWTRATDGELASQIEAILDAPPTAEQVKRARRLFALVLDTPGGLKIQTVHSFCQSVLGRFPLEAGVPPRFEVLDERSAAELMQRARDRVLTLAGRDPALADALRAITRRVQEDRFDTLMRMLSAERSRFRRLTGADAGGVPAAINALYRTFEADPDSGEAEILEDAVRYGAFDAIGLSGVVDVLRTDGSPKQDGATADKIAAWIEAGDGDRARGFEAYRSVFYKVDGAPRERLATKKVTEAHPHVATVLNAERNRLDRIDLKIRQQVTAESSAALVRLGAALLVAYEEEKQRHAQLDYDDLILKTQALLRDGRAGAAAWVMYKLDGGLDHILVDEAQDTNPEQWDVIAGLADDFFAGEGQSDRPRTLFAVGDVKQSIYSFQRADPDRFHGMRAHFEARIEEARMRFRTVPMSVSFRSTPAVLRAVDATFADPASKDGLTGPDGAIVHYPHRKDDPGRVELWPLITPIDAEETEPWSPPVSATHDAPPAARMAERIAAQVADTIGSETLPSLGRRVRAGDIMVLVQRRTGFVDMLIRALKKRGVPVAGVDRMVLSEEIGVMDLVALANVLLLPEDDLTLATVLKGPFIGFDDDALYRLAYDRKGTPLWRRLEALAASDPACGAAWVWLSALFSVADFIRPTTCSNVS